MKITRRSKIGWGWGYPAPTKPDYTGTIKQVLGQIANDKPLHASRGTFIVTRWFVPVNGQWVPIKNQYPGITWLMEKDDKGKYAYDSIEVELECPHNNAYLIYNDVDGHSWKCPDCGAMLDEDFEIVPIDTDIPY